jgi:hypothetical protein
MLIGLAVVQGRQERGSRNLSPAAQPVALSTFGFRELPLLQIRPDRGCISQEGIRESCVSRRQSRSERLKAVKGHVGAGETGI